jgi:peptide-methionine (S)-S-oxide reductase
MTVRLESVTFTSGDGATRVPSYLATPDRDGPHPVVLILRGVAGPDDGYTEIARRLAEWGYVALVHGWKVRGADPTDEPVYSDLQGAMLSTRVGYTGGSVSHATYRNHGSHAEAVEVIFDPARISYRQILEFFFQIHDPSTRNRQGNDFGTSYRSAIFYTSDEQKRIAEDTIADVDASGLWPGKAVTEVVPAGDFWEAEPEHQDYLQRYPDGYTCHFVRSQWRLPIRTEKVAKQA